ncbi:MAG: hypothetical protein ACRDHZ_19715, partial [Ktedonobacteraceae bacterium]
EREVLGSTLTGAILWSAVVPFCLRKLVPFYMRVSTRVGLQIAGLGVFRIGAVFPSSSGFAGSISCSAPSHIGRNSATGIK